MNAASHECPRLRQADPRSNAPGKLDPQTKRLVREGVDLVLDPGMSMVSRPASACRKDAGEVTVISMGPPKAVDAIRRALAMGAHRGILITDPALETPMPSAPPGHRGRHQGADYDLIICGTESTDGSSGAMPAQLAELLGCAAQLCEEAGGRPGQGRDRRQTDEGYDVVEAPLPAVVTVTGGINEARYPALRGIMQAKNKEVKQVG